MAIHKHKVMSAQSGHDTLPFDTADKVAVKDAEKRFNELTKVQRMTAVRPGPDGKPGEILTKFDPNVEETIFMPQLQGG